RVLAVVGRNHAVHRLGRDQPALPRVEEEHVVRVLGDVGRDGTTGNAGGHAVVRRVLLVGVVVVVLDHVPVFRLVDRPVGAAAAQQRRGALGLLVVQRTVRIAREDGDDLPAVDVARDRLALDGNAVVGELIR